MRLGDVFTMAILKSEQDEVDALYYSVYNKPARKNATTMAHEAACRQTRELLRFRDELAKYGITDCKTGVVDHDLKTGCMICRDMDDIWRTADYGVRDAFMRSLEDGELTDESYMHQYKGAKLAYYHIDKAITEYLGRHLK